MAPDERIWRERGLRSAVLAGDERAWQAWYEETYPALEAYVVWRCAGRHEWADEVLQETWLTAVRRVRHFDPDQGSFAAWLRGIAANVLRNQLRLRRKHLGRTQPLNGEGPAAPSSTGQTMPADQAEQIAAALAALPPRYEAVLSAKYLEQQSVAQIAAAWDETTKAVESLLTRARQAFRHAYLNLEHPHERHPDSTTGPS